MCNLFNKYTQNTLSCSEAFGGRSSRTGKMETTKPTSCIHVVLVCAAPVRVKRNTWYLNASNLLSFDLVLGPLLTRFIFPRSRNIS